MSTADKRGAPQGPWTPGDRVAHRFNPDLGPGRITAVEGRYLRVHFPLAGEQLTIAADTGSLEPLVLRAGCRAMLESSGEEVQVAEVGPGSRCRLGDGREVDEAELWPLPHTASLFDRLAAGEIDRLEDFANRLDALHLASLREGDRLASFLGGRIQLFPHQLYVAERATRADPVRWLLADEVGLGKTVEACLIQSHLLRTGRVERVLVVAPATLTVQWLGELWRKYHEVYVLLDDKRLNDVARDYGEYFNPFDVHRRVVASLEMLVERPRLVEQAQAAGVEMVIVDEAHHLRRREGHPGNPAYRTLAPLIRQVPHALLLTATPLEDDAEGFLRLLQLLHPERFPDGSPLLEVLDSGAPLPACTSVTRRQDLGGLPPRRPLPVDIDEQAWAPIAHLEQQVAALPADTPPARARKADLLRRALSSGAAVLALPDSRRPGLEAAARRAVESDPRLDFLAQAAPEWERRREKTLIFVSCRETLEMLRAELSRRCQLATAVFHEDLSPARRDIEVAGFRTRSGPSLLVSTECGGEGRNFEFCHRLVMYDLPWSPGRVEQRIGRLDRIGRRMNVGIVYFRPPGGIAAAVVRLYERIGLMERPLEGLQRELRRVEQLLDEAAAAGRLAEDEHLEALVQEVEGAWSRIQQAAYRHLLTGLYDPACAEEILARLPDDMEALTEDVVLGAADCLGLEVESQRQEGVYSVALGSRALVESLPGLGDEFSFVGTFDRETAVDDEMIDFFASGHPLVEAILAEVQDSSRGRTAMLACEIGDDSGLAVVGFYREEGRLVVRAVDHKGRRRVKWEQRLAARPLRVHRIDPEAWTSRPGWAATVRAIATELPGDPVAAAALVVGAVRPVH